MKALLPKKLSFQNPFVRSQTLSLLNFQCYQKLASQFSSLCRKQPLKYSERSGTPRINLFFENKSIQKSMQIRNFCSESTEMKKMADTNEIPQADEEIQEELIDIEKEFFGEVPDLPKKRSFLYVPASDIKKIQKSATLDADVLCFDLEDGVALNEKKQARRNLSEWLPKLKFGNKVQKPEILIRINKVGSGYEIEDIRTLFGKASFIPDGIVIPKCEEASQIQSLITLLAEYENRAYVNGLLLSKDKTAETNILEEKDPNKYIQKVVERMKRFSIYCGIESAKGLLNLQSILMADERVEGVLFGAEDYRNSIRSNFNSYFHSGNQNSNLDLIYARSQIINYCSVYGKDAIDKVSLNFNNDPKSRKLLLEEAKESFMHGFAGKQIIHPNQISIVHKAFSPSLEETMEAMRIVKMYMDHQKVGQGAFQLDGKMIDAPIALQAARIIQSARISGDLNFEGEVSEEEEDGDLDLEGVDKDLLEDLKLVDIESANFEELSEADVIDSIEFDSGVDVEDQLDKLLEKKKRNSRK